MTAVLTLSPTSRRDAGPIKALVLDAISNSQTKIAYSKALDTFFGWKQDQGQPPFTQASVQAYRTWLEQQGYASSTINQCLTTVRKLASAAAANGLLDAATAAAIGQVRGVPEQTLKQGDFLTLQQAMDLLQAPNPQILKGKRDRAILSVLLGCALGCSEVAALTTGHVQQRDGRWVIVDLRGQGGRNRPVPMPEWVKQALDSWTDAASVSEGKVFRAINRYAAITRDSLSTQTVRDVVKVYTTGIGLRVRPRDLRRTCGRLCLAGGGGLPQIQHFLGHSSIDTTQRFLGPHQYLADAPNDRLGLHL